MPYILHTYTQQPTFDFTYHRITALQSEEWSLSKMVDGIVRNYEKPVLITWYKLDGVIEFYLIKWAN